MTENERDCLHGNLARSCDACETAAEIAELRATLAAERAQAGEEIDEFNAGWQACVDGLPDSAEPSGIKHDQWRVGYAHAAYDGLKSERDALRSELAEAMRVLEEVQWFPSGNCPACGGASKEDSGDGHGGVCRIGAFLCRPGGAS